MSIVKPTLSYAAQQVLTYDPDRFYATLFAPPTRREDLWSLYAFDHDIQTIAQKVTEPLAGFVRLQWWRDQLTGIYAGNKSINHPVLIPLADAIRTYDLPLKDFDILLQAHEQDLNPDACATIDSVIEYAAGTWATVSALASRITTSPSPETQSAIYHAGIVGGLSDILLGRSPLNFASKEALLGTIDEHYALAIRALPRAPRSLLPILFPTTLAKISLKRWIREKPDTTAPYPYLRHRSIHLLWAWARGRW